MDPLSLQLWQERFREHLAVRQWSARTIDTYTAELRPCLAFLQAQGLTSLAGLTREHLEAYRTHLYYQRFRGRALALSTQRVRFGAVKQFVRFLVRTRVLLLDLTQELDLPRAPRGLPRVLLTESETRRLLEAPDTSLPLGVRDRTILEVFYGTGIRNSELGRLRLDQVDLERQVLHIDHGKGNKARVVPLGEEALAWLEEYLTRVRPGLVSDPEQELVFVSARGRAFRRTELAQVVARWARRSGLTKPVTPHVLRHCCATHMLRRGAGLRHLQVLLGHASPETTQQYTRVEVSDLRKVLLRCHPRERS